MSTILDTLEALERAASAFAPAPWHTETDEAGDPDDVVTYLYHAREATVNPPYAPPDVAAFIAAAVNALPALLRLARAVAEERDAMRAVNEAREEPALHDALSAHSAAHREVVAALAALEGEARDASL